MFSIVLVSHVGESDPSLLKPIPESLILSEKVGRKDKVGSREI